MNKLALAFCACFALIGCGGRDTADDGVCDDLTRQANDYVAAHRSCNVDGDCAGEAAYPFVYDMGSDVSCWPAIVISSDAASGFVSLMDQMRAAKCTGPTRVCSALFPVPRCVQQACTYP